VEWNYRGAQEFPIAAAVRVRADDEARKNNRVAVAGTFAERHDPPETRRHLAIKDEDGCVHPVPVDSESAALAIRPGYGIGREPEPITQKLGCAGALAVRDCRELVEVLNRAARYLLTMARATGTTLRVAKTLLIDSSTVLR